MFYLTTHSTHFIYGYMASELWLRTILIVRKETCCRHIGYSYRLTEMVILYAPSHRQDNTYHSLCYTSRGEDNGWKRMRSRLCRPSGESKGQPPLPKMILKILKTLSWPLLEGKLLCSMQRQPINGNQPKHYLRQNFISLTRWGVQTVPRAVVLTRWGTNTSIAVQFPCRSSLLKIFNMNWNCVL